MPEALKKGFLALTASLVTLGFIVVGFEAVARARHARWRAGYEQSGAARLSIASLNPVLGWEYRPNARVLSWGDIRTNRHGFRDRADVTLEKARGVVRVAFVGDSLTLGLDVPEPETFVRRFEALANEARPIPRTEALNFGVGGYDTVQVAELLRTRALAFDPDQVVYTLCWNDFDFEDASRSMGLYFRPPGSFFLRAVRDARRRLAGGEYHHVHFAETRAVVFDTIGRMHETVSGRGGRFRVAIVPLFSGAWDPYPLADIQAELQAFLVSRGIPFLDLLADFRAAGQAPGQVSLDAWHPNAQGSRVIAASLVRSVLADGPVAAAPR